MQKDIARKISYAASARSRGGRAFVRLLENATGRISLIKPAQGYEHEVAAGRDFWQVIVERYGLSLDVVGGSLANIPANDPLILLANHPYGILDGLMMGYILSVQRGDFRIIAHQVFRKARELDRVILPIDFDETEAALKRNLQTRADALSYLKSGGTVATTPKPFGRPMDPVWRIVVGEPIPPAEIAARAGDAKAMMDFLRRSTYELSPKPLPSLVYGFEFEEKYRA